MKKIIAMLLAVVMVLGLVACASSSDTKADTSTPADTTDNAGTETADTETKTDDTAADTATSASGKVYYLNFKPEFDEALQKLASDYTAKTGVAVKVVTAASGTYSDTLTAEMGKNEAPTIFNIGNMSGLADWDDYALDLTGSVIANEDRKSVV